VGVVGNPEKGGARRVICAAVELVQATGREVLTEAATAAMAGLTVPQVPDTAALARNCELLLVFGGDGTMLRVAREAAGTATPLLGINLGRLGFLTTSSARQLERTLALAWSGRCQVDERPLIEASGQGKAGALAEVALNDFVISHGMVPRLIELELKVDGDLLTSYRGDGLIVSSPTGSTAYSLAAGGAVVSPRASVFAITPICPHTLSSRSVIVNLDSRLEVRLLSGRVETFLAADGHTRAELSTGNVVRFRRSRQRAHLVRLPGASFFETLRQKLNWSGSPV
jgi:NAD+ kinase